MTNIIPVKVGIRKVGILRADTPKAATTTMAIKVSRNMRRPSHRATLMAIRAAIIKMVGIILRQQ